MYANVTLRQVYVDICDHGSGLKIEENKKMWEAQYGDNDNWRAVGETRGEALKKLGEKLPVEDA